MSDVTKLMIKIWSMERMDWLGFENLEQYSFHHIKKKCDGGEKKMNNGAILHKSSHELLHTIEHYDLDKYIYLNKILKDVNTQRFLTTKEQLEQIRLVLIEFQKEYENKLSSRDKPIIKKEYLLKY